MELLQATHPSLWERFMFLLERFARMHVINPDVTFNAANTLFAPRRPLTQTELDEIELISCSSAVWHLMCSETRSRWSGDDYLNRLVKAKPEIRAKALAEHGLTEADYERWLEIYSETPAIH